MPDLKISEWPPADDLTGDEILPLVQGGQNRRSTVGAATASAGGLPTGGTAGQLLAKSSDDNYDTEWVDPEGDSVTALSISSGTVTVDLAGGLNRLFTLTLNANVTDWTFNNKPGSGRGGSIMIEITQGATPYTVAVPTATKHTGGEMPVGSGAVAVLALTSFDNWTTAWTTYGVDE